MITIKTSTSVIRDREDHYRLHARAHTEACPHGTGQPITLPDAREVEGWLVHFAAAEAKLSGLSKAVIGECDCLPRLP